MKISRIAYELGYRAREGKIFSPLGKRRASNKDYHGYCRCTIRIDKKPHQLYTHRLAAFQKFGERMFGNGIVVRHLDGNPENNLPENISIGTQSDNMLDRAKEKRMVHAIRAGRSNSILEDRDVRDIRKLVDDGITFSEITRRYGIAKSTISAIKNRKTYKYVQ